MGYVTPGDFEGYGGAYRMDCHECDADAHVIGWNRFRDEDKPAWCPYCGSDDVEFWDESVV
jgi:hypothetical protein